MKGLVLAGGRGTRLRPLTHHGAKQLVPVANRPIVFYVIDNLVDAGIRDIGVVIAPETGDAIRAALGDGARWSARITYLLQPRPDGLADAVRVARPFLGNDPFCMFLGDNLLGSRVTATVEAFAARPEVAASLLVKEVSNPSSFGVAEVDAGGAVTRLVEKPVAPRSNLALVGVYLLRPPIFEAIERITPSPRGELEITDALNELVRAGHTVVFDRLASWWLDTGKKDDLLLANRTVLDDWLEHAVEGAVDDASIVSGRVRIEAGAEVIRSTIEGPAVIGAGARITDAKIGPFTSIGDGVTVERSEVAGSVVLADCRVADVPRLDASLLGCRVEVVGVRQTERGVSLVVGDDGRVEVAR